MFVNVATKSAQHAHARMITIIVEIVQTQIIWIWTFSTIIDIYKRTTGYKLSLENEELQVYDKI